MLPVANYQNAIDALSELRDILRTKPDLTEEEENELFAQIVKKHFGPDAEGNGLLRTTMPSVPQVAIDMTKASRALLDKSAPAHDRLQETSRVGLRIQRAGDPPVISVLTILEDSLIQLPELNPFDASVLRALTSIVDYLRARDEAWYVIPIRHVARKLYASDATAEQFRPSEKQIEAIWSSLRRMSGLMFQLDWQQEAEMRDCEYAPIEGPIVSFRRGPARVNGVTADCVFLFCLPAPYEYAWRTGAIQRIPDTLIAGGPRRKTERVLAIKAYLSERIVCMYRQPELRRVIRLNTLLKHLRLEKPTRNDKRNIRDAVKAYLDAWIGTEFILGYAFSGGYDRSTGLTTEEKIELRLHEDRKWGLAGFIDDTLYITDNNNMDK